MLWVRKSGDRGRTTLDWLDSRHTFSFGGYYDPAQRGFSKLLVINDDVIGPGKGFAPHSHQDMEIVTCVLTGALEHRDSTGNSGVIVPGELQRMSAGAGITHSEYNHSPTEPVHLLQIWIEPNVTGIKPGYEQKKFAAAQNGALTLVASPDGADESLTIHQDARLYLADLASGRTIERDLDPSRRYYLQVARGRMTVGEFALVEGDGLKVTRERALAIKSSGVLALLFDLP